MSRIFLPISLALLLLVPLSMASAQEKLKFATPTRTSPLYNLPVIAAEENGFWKERGLDATYFPFQSGAPMYMAMAAGSVPIGISSTESLVFSVLRRLPLIIVADLQAVQDWSIFVSPNSTIRKPQDLRGAKVGIAGFGTQPHYFIQAIVKALALDRVKVVATGGTREAMAALKAGTVDAVLRPLFPVIPLIERGEIRQLDISLMKLLPRDWMDATTIAVRSLIDDKPDVTKKLIDGAMAGTRVVMTDQRWTQEKLKSLFGYSDWGAREAYPLLKYGKDGKISRKGVESVINFLVEFGLVKKTALPPVDQFYTARFTD